MSTKVSKLITWFKAILPKLLNCSKCVVLDRSLIVLFCRYSHSFCFLAFLNNISKWSKKNIKKFQDIVPFEQLNLYVQKLLWLIQVKFKRWKTGPASFHYLWKESTDGGMLVDGMLYMENGTHTSSPLSSSWERWIILIIISSSIITLSFHCLQMPSDILHTAGCALIIFGKNGLSLQHGYPIFLHGKLQVHLVLTRG